MKEALEPHRRFFPANAEAAIVLQPANRSFNRPAASVSTQWAPVLGLVFLVCGWRGAGKSSPHLSRPDFGRVDLHRRLCRQSASAENRR